ncbi:MAG: hypothetical protein KAS16_00635 [Thermoplasmata archaeon]|nr:hypothetical protein [Thermoplasmata archaeon]
MNYLEFHILKLKMADGCTADVPMVILKTADGKIIKRMSYKQYKEASRKLPPLQASPNLKHLLEQMKRTIKI